MIINPSSVDKVVRDMCVFVNARIGKRDGERKRERERERRKTARRKKDDARETAKSSYLFVPLALIQSVPGFFVSQRVLFGDGCHRARVLCRL